MMRTRFQGSYPLEAATDLRTGLIAQLRQRGYQLEQEGFVTGRPDRTTLGLLTVSGERVVAKVYPNGSSGRAYADLEKLWHSSFGRQRKAPGLPQPLEHLADLSVILLARLEGQPLVECEHPSPRLYDSAMRLLAALHDCDARPEARRDSRGIVRSARRKAERIGELAPDLEPLVRRVVEALEAKASADNELVPSHGDFSARNVFVAVDRVVFIDWDRFQWADPMRDLAYFGTWSWAASLRRGGPGNWSVLESAVSAYRLARPHAQISGQLDFHIAAGLLRMSCSLVALWPEQVNWVPKLLKEALRRLE